MDSVVFEVTEEQVRTKSCLRVDVVGHVQASLVEMTGSQLRGG